MLEEATEEIDLLVPFGHELVAEEVAHRERPEGADRVGKEGVGPVEGVDITGIGPDLRPPGGLHRAGDLQREDVEILFRRVRRNPPLVLEAEEITNRY